MRPDPSPASLAAVDAVIAPRLGPWGRQPLGHMMRPVLDWVIDRKGAARLADQLAGLDGDAAMAAMAARLRLDMTIIGREHIPQGGPAILVCNHPTGAADGIAIIEALRPVRADISFFSSDEALKIAPGLSRSLIPVRMDKASRTLAMRKTMLRALNAAISGGRLLVMMPAGALSLPCKGGLQDPPWTATPIHLARRFSLPVLPVHIGARNSALHYALGAVSPRLRDLTVFRELMNKTGAPFAVRIGAPIEPGDLLAGDAEHVVRALQTHVDAMQKGGGAFASPP
jgi:putative hemolysin